MFPPFLLNKCLFKDNPPRSDTWNRHLWGKTEKTQNIHPAINVSHYEGFNIIQHMYFKVKLNL